jgi:hypothetical protein
MLLDIGNRGPSEQDASLLAVMVDSSDDAIDIGSNPVQTGPY